MDLAATQLFTPNKKFDRNKEPKRATLNQPESDMAYCPASMAVVQVVSIVHEEGRMLCLCIALKHRFGALYNINAAA